MVNILIYGSCVSRDAFRLIRTGHHVTGFISRNPLATAFRGRPVAVSLPDLDPESTLQEGFPRRMLELNLAGKVPDYLRSRAREADLILVDLIDERLPLIDIEGDAVCLCQEMSRIYQPREDQRIGFDSERRKRLTMFGMSALLMLAQDLRIPVMLNPAKWSTHPDAGREAAFSAIRNQELDRIISMFRGHGVPMVNYADHEFRPDPNHLWGAAPYHYTSETYEILIDQIETWSRKFRTGAA